MMSLDSSLLTALAGLTLASLTIFVIYYKWSFAYWKKLNVPYLEPRIPMGNMANTLTATENFGIVIKHIYDQLKSQKVRLGGLYIFSTPAYIVIDLEYVKNVLSKDFQYFVDRGIYHNEEVDPLSAHLFNLDGEKWRNTRNKLNSAFTSGKMKMMFETLLHFEKNLHEEIDSLCKSGKPVDVKKLLCCYMIDVIGSASFGLECNSFEADPAPFREYGLRFFNMTTWECFLFWISVAFPKLAKALGLRVVPKIVSDFFSNVVKDNVEYRERNNYVRNDFMQLLIKMKSNNFTLEQIAAQSFGLFLGGFETTSNSLSWTMYELAKNQDIQNKVREEINAVVATYGGKVTYDGIQDMKYLGQIMDETLRKYPAGGVYTRICNKDYKVPDQDIVIKKGTRLLISVLGIHRDEEYYPDPEKFDPERFNEENSRSRPRYAHLPFGEGPRTCIGIRFGRMQSKVSLASLLKNYKFTLNEKTEPPKFAVNSFLLVPAGDIWLNVERI
ncbi:cytochrome P450 6A1-like [Zophobas morio]|uniref:cytochrome P450 6A1-like n=1 Tax=Zophobas morio TaxID=2755281 RepID=UPI00308291A8